MGFIFVAMTTTSAPQIIYINAIKRRREQWRGVCELFLIKKTEKSIYFGDNLLVWGGLGSLGKNLHLLNFGWKTIFWLNNFDNKFRLTSTHLPVIIHQALDPGQGCCGSGVYPGNPGGMRQEFTLNGRPIHLKAPCTPNVHHVKLHADCKLNRGLNPGCVPLEKCSTWLSNGLTFKCFDSFGEAQQKYHLYINDVYFTNPLAFKCCWPIRLQRDAVLYECVCIQCEWGLRGREVCWSDTLTLPRRLKNCQRRQQQQRLCKWHLFPESCLHLQDTHIRTHQRLHASTNLWLPYFYDYHTNPKMRHVAGSCFCWLIACYI